MMVSRTKCTERGGFFKGVFEGPGMAYGRGYLEVLLSALDETTWWRVHLGECVDRCHAVCLGGAGGERNGGSWLLIIFLYIAL